MMVLIIPLRPRKHRSEAERAAQRAFERTTAQLAAELSQTRPMTLREALAIQEKKREREFQATGGLAF